ncbi:MAG: 3'(2'),5'-bisphosphate nucleotidase [Gemmatimonadales bacterium]|nr:MAG: 3'(2'),5'-bisphosphate nucleotidase [Gemmatimonadales bacterium]
MSIPDAAPIAAIAREAGLVILGHYGAGSPVEIKPDDSPLTQADRSSHRLIVDRLQAAFPGLPVLSEESAAGEIVDRRSWDRFWLVDPLDGTREFLRQTGEFTVNIALIEGGKPVLGVVHVPAQDVTYFAREGEGAFRRDGDGEPRRIRVGAASAQRLVVVASRDHAGPEVAAILAAIAASGVEADSTSMGSSLKFCLIAEGKADLYPRTVPTMEWDTAAAQCIVEAAGGRVTTLDGVPLRYNKESLRNPSIMTAGDASLDWRQYLG